MRKNIFGKQLKRDRNERKALFKSLLSSLVMYETIKTSEAKAKAIKPSADKLITKAKKGGLPAYRMLEPDLSTEAVKKLLSSIAPRFTNRQGGYTRIIRVGKRLKDQAQEVILEWTERQTLPVSGPAGKIEGPKVKPMKKNVKEAKASTPNLSTAQDLKETKRSQGEKKTKDKKK